MEGVNLQLPAYTQCLVFVSPRGPKKYLLSTYRGLTSLLLLFKFDDAFRPKRLLNWETPRWDPEKPFRDPFNFTKTDIVVNEKGHLLPGVHRADRNPWNNYVGTNDMPAVITKAIGE